MLAPGRRITRASDAWASGRWLAGFGEAGLADFHVGKLAALGLTNGHFWRPRLDYKRDDATFVVVICQLWR
ncbi:hypothetical protein [Neomesorhizobium albiziae]|uniref:hypothetical protein n=1 Tax=Neomesorhizobium albiziae TaxID=335020 RepID=UPI00122C24BB|nr:hypothetical protein [Mesorhizobium albiziae]GLS29430.1 hypothetical protein GCM10007937_11380 [Mesorhizobium albiziae]